MCHCLCLAFYENSNQFSIFEQIFFVMKIDAQKQPVPSLSLNVTSFVALYRRKLKLRLCEKRYC